MTLIYIPQPIKTVEQAEQLPEGTIAKHPEYRTAAVKTDLCEEGIALWYDTDDGSQTATSLLGWQALVPVEAEEEFFLTRDGVPFGLPMDEAAARTDAARNAHRGAGVARRWITEWEPVAAPDRRGDDE